MDKTVTNLAQNEIKRELIDESTPSWICGESQSTELKHELKTEVEFFDNSQDAKPQATTSQVNFEFVGIIEEPVRFGWKKCQPLRGEDPYEDENKGKLKLTNELEKMEEIVAETIKKISDDQCFTNDFDHCGKINKLEAEFSTDDNTNATIDDANSVPESLTLVQKPKPYECSNCEVSFTAKRSLAKHRLAIHGERTYHECIKCQGTFSSKQSLNRHILSVHDKFKPFICPFCGYACSQNGDMSAHIKTVHVKLKPFKCNECNYTSSKKSDLLLHVKSVHDKYKPYMCSECSFTCSHRGNLLRHIQCVHEKLKPYSCLDCDYATGDKRNFSRHVRGVHEKFKSIEY